jgi:hypothetical protein
MKKSLYLSFFLFVLWTGAYSQQLTQTEQKIIQTLRQQQAENEKFLEKVVNINSGTLNKEGVRTVGKLMAEEFNKPGFKTEWVTFVQAVDAGKWGGSDISFVGPYLPCLDGLGAPGKGQHSIEETMFAKEYPLLIQRAALFIYRLTR